MFICYFTNWVCFCVCSSPRTMERSDHARRCRNYKQRKGVSMDEYIREKYRLWLLWKATELHEMCHFRFQNEEAADCFFQKWQNGDFNTPEYRGTIFASAPARSVDHSPRPAISNFCSLLNSGMRNKSVRNSFVLWARPRYDSDNLPTLDEIFQISLELEEARQLQKEMSKLQKLIFSTTQIW